MENKLGLTGEIFACGRGDDVEASNIKRLNQFGDSIFCPYADPSANSTKYLCEDSRNPTIFEASCLGIFTNCDKYKNLNWARKIPNHI